MRFLKSDTGPGAGELNGFVDKGSHVHGELRFDAAFRIDGKVEGTIVSEGDLVIGDGGEVDPPHAAWEARPPQLGHLEG